ncbi:hypothetical protein A2U01_0008578 [Trifolium medium]|uniref:Uncharacterized protein n=1 Tax=Trifolium medium TaxID=97028 RepID=A0A392MJM6_9FABA|nr:hypothetical protein [Trifolium medium]
MLLRARHAPPPAQRAAGRGCQRQQARTRTAPALVALRANTNCASRTFRLLVTEISRHTQQTVF